MAITRYENETIFGEHQYECHSSAAELEQPSEVGLLANTKVFGPRLWVLGFGRSVSSPCDYNLPAGISGVAR